VQDEAKKKNEMIKKRYPRIELRFRFNLTHHFFDIL